MASIGVHVSRDVTTHGFALNVETDLTWFDAIVPCGISDVRITSIERLLCTPGLPAVEDALIEAFATVFESLPVCPSASLPAPSREPSKEPVLSYGH